MPDERDWFQVVTEQECEECALEARALAQGALGAAISEEGHRWGALLTKHYKVEVLRRRPGADVWSAIEYAAHVRDVLCLFRDRVVLTLSRHQPEFVWGTMRLPRSTSVTTSRIPGRSRRHWQATPLDW